MALFSGRSGDDLGELKGVGGGGGVHYFQLLKSGWLNSCLHVHSLVV